jgi:hypothetical protein
MVLPSSSSRCHLTGGEVPRRSPMVPLTAVVPDKTRGSGYQNRIVWFFLFWIGASDSCPICVPTHFDDSVGKSTTSRLSSLKKGGPDVNGSDLNKNNIINPTFDTLTEEDCKALEAYHAEVDELFYSCYEVTRQGLVLKDTSSIIIHKAEVTPEVRSNPLLSLDDVQSMINSALERQTKICNKLVRRLIDERDRKKLVDSNVNPSSSCTFNFAQTNHQPSGTSAGDTSQPNPSAQSMNHFYSRTTIDSSAPIGGMP